MSNVRSLLIGFIVWTGVVAMAGGVQAQEYEVPEALRSLASKYNVSVHVPAEITYDDFLTYVGVVATERARSFEREATKEDYEFALATGCVPIPNWPKDPPPQFQARLASVIRDAFEDPNVRQDIEARLTKDLLFLSREEFHRRDISVTAVLDDLPPVPEK